MDFSSYKVLDSILAVFVNAANTGFNLLSGEVVYLTTILMVIAIAFTGFKVTLGGSSEMITAGRRAMLWTVVIYLTNTWADKTDLIRQTALELGLRASGNTASDIGGALAPSYIVDLGAQQMITLMNIASDSGGVLGVVGAPLDTLVLGFAGIVIFIAFLIMALQLMITIIEFKLLTLASFILIPFGILTRTNFLMERSLGYVASAALKFLALAFVLAISINIVEDFALNAHKTINIDVGTGLRMMAVAIVIAGLSISIPAAAASLVTGGPSLGIGALAGGAAVGAAAGVGIAGAGAAAASGASAASGNAGSLMSRVQSALSAGGGALQTPGSLVTKATGVSAGAAASQGPRGGIGETSPGTGDNS
ncbi:MAG: hypothetical protein HEP70_16810 [Rhodobiaceae bacterium]|jgi:type IV secretion system protein TrbL|nr:hypothetical protein [Rhodobiaceae bacterium]